MKSDFLKGLGAFTLLTIFVLVIEMQQAKADTAAEIDRQVDAALQMLYGKIPKAKELSTKAKGLLVFPDDLRRA